MLTLTSRILRKEHFAFFFRQAKIPSKGAFEKKLSVFSDFSFFDIKKLLSKGVLKRANCSFRKTLFYRWWADKPHANYYR
jgi:hypothetical protein